jgi:hypothetical protein
MIESLLYKMPAASLTIGAARVLRVSGSVVQPYSCCSFCASLICAEVKALAASLTSSLRLGIEPPSLPMLWEACVVVWWRGKVVDAGELRSSGRRCREAWRLDSNKSVL